MDIIVLIILGILALIGWLSYIRYRRYQSNINNGNERLNIVLERFGDRQDFFEFLQSTQGMRALNTMTFSATSTKVPILVMICSGVVTLAIGLAALVLTLIEDGDFIFATAFMSATGIGLMLAAMISYRLSRKWKIFEDNDMSGQTNEPFQSQQEQPENFK